MRGTWTLNVRASQPVTRSINQAELRWLVQPAEQLVIDVTRTQTTLTFDGTTMSSPSNGTPVEWTAPTGSVYHLSTEWENRRLEQTLQGTSTRTASFRMSQDGQTLTLHGRVTGPQLRRPLSYRLVYNRAS